MHPLDPFPSFDLHSLDPRAQRILEQSGARCSIDGALVRTHPRCSRCGVSAGPGHPGGLLLGGICAACRASGERVKREEELRELPDTTDQVGDHAGGADRGACGLVSSRAR